MNIVIVTNRSWYEPLADNSVLKNLGIKATLITNINEVNVGFLASLSPKYIFFPHWSYIIPEEVFESFECVIFHMTNLPFGRGGSPLQNLIVRKIYETKITALRCEKELDAGPIYMQTPLSLHGNAEEIYLRAASIVQEMIIEILEKQPIPTPQQGKPVIFRRRKPHESNIEKLETLEEIHNFIRMLDAEGYPKAFFKIGKLHFEFSRSSRKFQEIHADVRIKINE